MHPRLEPNGEWVGAGLASRTDAMDLLGVDLERFQIRMAIVMPRMDAFPCGGGRPLRGWKIQENLCLLFCHDATVDVHEVVEPVP